MIKSIGASLGILPVLALPIVLISEALILAQVAMPDSAIPGLAANFGGYGLLGWYLYYTTRYAGPRAQDKNAEVLKALVTDFREEMREVRLASAQDRDAFRTGLQCNVSLLHENELLKKK